MIIWVFVFLAITDLVLCESAVTRENEDCVNADFKCTDKDTRKGIYLKCAMNKDFSLWCNHSQFQSIPNASNVLSYMSGSNASALYIRDSCLTKITRGDVAQYPNITEFTCGKNYIEELPEKLFSGNKKLKLIEFCLNVIKAIAPDAFHGLSKLEELNLASNDISEIPENMFQGLVSLKELSFHNNKITLINDDTFVGLNSLKILRLTANRLSHIKPKAFSNLKTLTHLHLDENKLDSLEPGVFGELTSLEVLTLSHNKFKGWPHITLAPSGIHTLNLASNLISAFTSTDVANMSQLQNLSLENNSLTHLSEDLFTETPNLRYINVAQNYIDNIPANTFCKLVHLETLVLSGNKLKTPSAMWFVTVLANNIPFGTNVSGNQWKCDCEITRYESFIDNLRVSEAKDPKWSKVLQVTCDSPKHWQGTVLDAKKKTEILREGKCPSQEPEPACNASVPTTAPFTRIPITYKYIPTTERKIETTESRLTTKREITARQEETTTTTFELGATAAIGYAKVMRLETAIVLLLAVALLVLAVTVFLCARRVCRKQSKRDPEKGGTAFEQAGLVNNRTDMNARPYPDYDQVYDDRNGSNKPVSSRGSGDSGYSEIPGQESDSYKSDGYGAGEYIPMQPHSDNTSECHPQSITTPKAYFSATAQGYLPMCSQAPNGHVTTSFRRPNENDDTSPACESRFATSQRARIEPDGLSTGGDSLSPTTEPKRLGGSQMGHKMEITSTC